MGLSELISALRVQFFAEVGLVLFMALFGGVLFFTFFSRSRGTFEKLRHLPLDDAGDRNHE